MFLLTYKYMFNTPHNIFHTIKKYIIIYDSLKMYVMLFVTIILWLNYDIHNIEQYNYNNLSSENKTSFKNTIIKYII